MGKPIEGSGADGEIDFEKDVLAKIEKTPDGREICPYCRKAKTVLRHLSKCKRAPPEVIEALEKYKAQKKGKKKSSGGKEEEDEDEPEDEDE